MRFGFTLPNNWGIDDPHQVIDLAVAAEDAGFDSVWVNHHVLNVGYVADRLDGRPYHDALTMLTWVASRTSRVRLGTSVLVLPYLHPMVLAKTLAIKTLSRVLDLSFSRIQFTPDLLPADLVGRVADRVKWASETVTDPGEMQTVMGTMIWMLQESGQDAAAEQLLTEAISVASSAAAFVARARVRMWGEAAATVRWQRMQEAGGTMPARAPVPG